MKSNVQIIDGEKAVSLTSEEGWTYFTNLPKTTQEEQYARVAAVFAGCNLIANTMASVPFVLYQGETEFDTSAKWENKCGFLPNPKDLIRLDTLSLLETNTFYNLRTKDALGYKTKGLYYAVPYSFAPVTDPITGELVKIVRRVKMSTVEFAPDDPKLVRGWWLDHTTEVLPSENTPAQAILNHAGQLFYADLWIAHFFRTGGIAPTLVAMKGLVTKEKAEDEEQKWWDFLAAIRKYSNRRAKVYNADALDVKQLGSSVTDLKNNEIYRSAIEGVAMGLHIPLSLLLSNSANYATATVENSQFFDDNIIPRCDWLAYEYNRQVWQPLGLRLEFKPETLDPEQEDETARAAAASQFMDFMGKCETYEVFIGACETFGYELSDKLISAAKQFFDEKKKKAEDMAAQLQKKPQPGAPAEPGQPPAPEQKPVPPPNEPKSAPEQVPPQRPMRWISTPNQLKELEMLRHVALRRWERHESLDFEYKSHYGGLPEPVQQYIMARLHFARSTEDIKDAFEPPAPPEPTDLEKLADAINRYADARYRVPASS